jgi:putative membrane protein
MWWGNGFGFNWGWMIFGWLIMLLFWGGLIAVAILAFRAFFGRQQSGTGGSSAPTHKTALDILKERYARGEITKEEYESMRRDLTT